MRITESQALEIKALVAKADSIVITSHKSPDGDAVGSTLAVYQVIKALGKKVTPVLPDAVPDFLQWMNDFSDIVFFDTDTEKATQLINEASLIFSLDYNNLSRTGSAMEAALRQVKGDFIMIDHHQQPESYPVVTYSDTAACSTCEMVYHFVDRCGWKEYITPQVAECIYCGIMTDSGSFRFPSVTPETHHIAADLIAGGLDHARVHREVYDTNLLDRLKLIGYSLNEKLVVIPEAGVAYIWLTQDELKRFNYRSGDTEGLVNQALSISGIKLAAFFREGNNEIKISFRSKGSFDVNLLARESWSGGGHKNAAGAASQLSMSDTLDRFVQQMKEKAPQILAS